MECRPWRRRRGTRLPTLTLLPGRIQPCSTSRWRLGWRKNLALCATTAKRGGLSAATAAAWVLESTHAARAVLEDEVIQEANAAVQSHGALQVRRRKICSWDSRYSAVHRGAVRRPAAPPRTLADEEDAAHHRGLILRDAAPRTFHCRLYFGGAAARGPGRPASGERRGWALLLAPFFKSNNRFGTLSAPTRLVATRAAPGARHG